jgi:hypothetical protein
MEDTSIFQDKSIMPTREELADKLGNSFVWWQNICEFVIDRYPAGKEEWTHSGKKYGWNFRIKDKKRAIIYLLPRANHFKAAFVFGQKAVDQIMESELNQGIKTELMNARKYAEGRGIRIEVVNGENLPDIYKLVEIKLNN